MRILFLLLLSLFGCQARDLSSPSSDCVPTLSCVECTQLSLCGFCFVDNTCASGDSSGATTGICHTYPHLPKNQWDWNGTECKNPPPTLPPTPSPKPIHTSMPFNGRACQHLTWDQYEYPMEKFGNYPGISFQGFQSGLNLDVTPCSTDLYCSKNDDLRPAMMCLENQSPMAQIILASGAQNQDIQQNSTWTMLDPSNPRAGLIVTVHNGMSSLLSVWSCPTSPTVFFKFVCDESRNNGDIQMNWPYQLDQCTFGVDIFSNIPCPYVN